MSDGWFSVKDRLPSGDTENLIVWIDDPIVPHWVDDEWRGRWYWSTMNGYADLVTHWRHGPVSPGQDSPAQMLYDVCSEILRDVGDKEKRLYAWVASWGEPDSVGGDDILDRMRAAIRAIDKASDHE